MDEGTLKTSRYLFLQGQISHFFSALGSGLQRAGHAVHRIHFNGGDSQFWALPGGVDFNGSAGEWPEFLGRQLSGWGISDLILFGDCRPLHAAAIQQARQRGIAVHVFEEGYLRPDFITLEEGGVNGHSALPQDAESYRQAAALLPAWSPVAAVPASFTRRASEDVLYHFSCLLSTWRFPHYRSHRPWHPFAEYAVGLRRFPLKALGRRRVEAQARAIEQGTRPYFVFPLQLDADAQIRYHAPAGGMQAAVRLALQSFARHAAAEALLVVTEHPLDYSPVDSRQMVARLAAETGLVGRVVFLRGGSPAPLVKAARGMVTVNSTIGITALQSNIPVIALGKAIYGLPGLTHQQGVDRFWTNPQPPDPALFDAFRRVVAARTQINGGFYSAEGIALAVAGALERLALAAVETRSRIAVVESLKLPANDEVDLADAWVPAGLPQPLLQQQYSVQT